MTPTKAPPRSGARPQGLERLSVGINVLGKGHLDENLPPQMLELVNDAY